MATKRRQGVNDAGNQRLNVRINPSAYQRLQIHCVMDGVSPGAFLEKLINDHCRSYRVQVIGSARVMTDDRLDAAEHVNPPALTNL